MVIDEKITKSQQGVGGISADQGRLPLAICSPSWVNPKNSSPRNSKKPWSTSNWLYGVSGCVASHYPILINPWLSHDHWWNPMQSPWNIWNHHGNSKRIAAAFALRMMRAISVRPSLSPPELKVVATVRAVRPLCDPGSQSVGIWVKDSEKLYENGLWLVTGPSYTIKWCFKIWTKVRRSTSSIDKRRFLLDLLGDSDSSEAMRIDDVSVLLEEAWKPGTAPQHTTDGLEISTLFSRRDFFLVVGLVGHQKMGVSENSVPLIPMVNDHYPY